MTELSNFLVDSIMNDYTPVVVYSGRFQPFHKGHYATYQHLVKKFGKDHVYIGTSDKTDTFKSPFNFAEKKAIMTKMFGIPADHIVRISNPYAPTEILSKFDPDTTALVVAVGEKDENRLGGKYFSAYKGTLDTGYDEHGYVYTVPSFPNPISGTDVRNWLSIRTDADKRKGFLKAYPKFNEQIYKFITLKLAKSQITEASGFGAFPHDGNSTTGHYWNKDWDEFDDPEPYIGCLPGWEILPIELNRLEQLKAGELPLNNHKDKQVKNNKLDLGIVPPQEYLDNPDTDKAKYLKRKPADTELETEEIKLDVKIGDTILMGKFKNKKVVVKTIGTDEHGMPTINGKKVATFRMLKEAASVSSGYGAEPGEPETAYTNAGAKRILDKTKPEPWFTRGGYKQLDIPKADWIQGKSKKNRDNDSMLRKATYTVKNMKTSKLNPVTDPYSTEAWQETKPGEKIRKPKRFWEEPALITKGEVADIVDDLTEELGLAMGYPSAEQLAAKQRELKRMRTKLNKTTTYSEPFALTGVTDSELNEVAWRTNTAARCLELNFPITNKVGRALYGDGTVTVFHITDANNMIQLEKMLGKSKSLSAFTYMNSTFLKHVRGIQTSGGVLLELEGKLLFSSMMDAMTRPDESGRRWVDLVDASQLPASQALERKFAAELKADTELWGLYNRMMPDTTHTKVPMTGKEKATFVANYIDLAEKFIMDNKIEFMHAFWKFGNEVWNEVIVNNIRVKDALVFNNYVEKSVTHSLESFITGKITHTNDPKDVLKFVKDRGGFSSSKKFDAQLREMAMPALKSIEKRADSKFDPIDIVTANRETDHFFQRLNDPRNGKEITVEELQWFFDRLARHKTNFIEFLRKYKDFVVKDKRTNINIPFMRQANSIIAKTIMRKRNFMSSNPEYVIESLQWETTALQHALHYNVPITPKVAKALYGDVSVRTFHTSDAAHIDDIRKVIGKKKALSTFSYMSDRVLGKMHGVQTNGGIIYELEGKLMLNSMVDAMSSPDKQGRRWLGMVTLSPNYSTYGEWMEATLADEFPEFFHEDPKTWTNEQKAQFIRKAIELAEDYVVNHKTEILDKLKSDAFRIERNTKYTWNEILVNDVVVRDVLVRVTPPVDDADNKEIADKLKPIATGTVYYTSDPKDAIKFVKDRGGFDYVQFMDRWEKGSPIGTTNYNTLTEGGNYGHLAHPFDLEMNLTLGDLKNIVKKALTGELGVVKEKTDGINYSVSWINGKLVASRNKSHVKNRGANAMSIDDAAAKFDGRGGIKDAYVFAMKDLEKAIGALSEKQREFIFHNGECFANLEVIYPEAANIIPYGQSLLVFHTIFRYDVDGEIIGQNTEAARTLAGMIKQVNQHVQDKYSIQGPPITELPKNEDLRKLQPKYLAMINKLQSEFGLPDSAGVADYHQAWWTDFVDKNASELPDNQKVGLVKRWAFNDKAFRIADITDPNLKAWADKIDKQDKIKITKDNTMKFEEIFLGVGSDILSFMTSILTVNPDEAKRKMVNRIKDTIKIIKSEGDPKKLEKLKLELKRLQAVGGFDRIVPNEGIVFEYPMGSGKIWKLTGSFASANKLLGILQYGD